MIWFTSDLHLGHANILRLAGRPWEDVDRMNAALVSAINARVMPGDTLYVLGDFSFKLKRWRALELRGRIWCRDVRLVPGNHDKNWADPEVAGAFAVEPELVRLHAGDRPLVLCHYPLMDWPSLRHGAIHLHGHLHAPASYNEWNRRQGLLRYDVGVDANGYAPVSLDEVLAYFAGVEHRRRVTRDVWEAFLPPGREEA